MKNMKELTATELLKQINDCKLEHDVLKGEIIEHTKEVDDLEVVINNKLKVFLELENKYITLIEEMNSRE